MRPLYEIDEEILGCVDQETGEIIDPAKLDALEIERDAKLEGIALWVKDLNAEAKAVKEEADKLTARQKAIENKASSLKAYLMTALDGQKLKTARCNVYYTHNTRLNVSDEASIVDYIQTHCREPEDFLKFGAPELRKDALKTAIKNGSVFPGVCLEQTESLVIK